MVNFQDKVSFIWNIAELLRGDYKQSEYGKVVLPLTVLRRLDCVLEPTKEKVLVKFAELKKMKLQNMAPVINKITKETFYNTSKFTFAKLKNEPDKIADNLQNYINGFSQNAREIIDCFEFQNQIKKLDDTNLLYKVVCRFAEIDLHPEVVTNLEMGYVFEELIRRFSEQSNETAGEHFTPREVIRLMVNILFLEDRDVLTKKGIVRTLYDPACGTGGMLSVGQDYLQELNKDARLEVFGQELNEESYAICKSDMMIKGQNADNIKQGNSFTKDGLPDQKFDYMLSNPPFGVDWKKIEDEINKEHESQGFGGRFGAGLPRVSDGSLLFLQHMISKMKQGKEGSRLAIVFNGSPLFTGSADSGESNIRKWIIENDMLEAIIGLPDQLFYNTGISTYIWVVTNRKSSKRKGKVQLINAVEFSQKMRKSLGNKRNEIGDGKNGKPDQIGEITKIYGDFIEGQFCKIFDNADFGYSRITVERPLKLSFQVTQDKIKTLSLPKGFSDRSDQILAALGALGSVTYKNRDKFLEAVNKVLFKADIKPTAQLEKAITSCFLERDEAGELCTDSKGRPESDADLRDNENVPLKENIQSYFVREVKPHVPDAWIDESKTKVGYEIPFTRHFYKYKPLRPLNDIDQEIKALEGEILDMLKGITA